MIAPITANLLAMPKACFVVAVNSPEVPDAAAVVI